MFKPLRVVLLCGLLGFGAYIVLSPEESPYEIGNTKSGERCRVIGKWGNGINDEQNTAASVRIFLMLNAEENVVKVDEYGLKYDCFFDIDTQEYELVDYEKTVKLRGGYRETYFFKNKNDSAECIRFQYNVTCENTNSTQQLFCYNVGECTQKKPELYNVGKTKAGEACRIISKWGNGGINDKQNSATNVQNFLQLNTENDGEVDEYEIKYDCLWDIDTQEYKLVDYEKTERLGGEFEVKYVFENRDKDAECIRFQYTGNCKNTNDRQQIHCSAYGQCTQEKFPLLIFITSMACVLLLFSFEFILIINAGNN